MKAKPIRFEDYLVSRAKKILPSGLTDSGKSRLISMVQERFRRAQTARKVEWEEQMTQGWRIRNNELPLQENIQTFSTWKGKYFVDNWLRKACTWKTSYLVGGDIFFDLKSYDGNAYADQQPYENEINFAFIFARFQREFNEFLNDWQYCGYGFTVDGWDYTKINPYFITGTPYIKYIDCRDIWFESTDGQIHNMSGAFHTERYNVDDLKLLSPDKDKLGLIKADNTTEQGSLSLDPQDNMMTILRYEFMLNIPIKKRQLKDRRTGDVDLYLEEEVLYYEEMLINDYTAYVNNNAIPDGRSVKIIMQFESEVIYPLRKQSGKDVPPDVKISMFTEMLNKNHGLPDQVEISEQSLTATETAWFRVELTNDFQLWEDIKYVGKRSRYKSLAGEKRRDSRYPFGIVYYLKDLQEISILVMTLLAILAVKVNKPTPFIEEDALTPESEAEFMESNFKLSFVGKISKKWRQTEVGKIAGEPVKWNNVSVDAQTPIALYQTINESIKNATGSVDSVRGVQQYSGQSGILAAQLQTAAQTFNKSDIQKWYDYLTEIGEQLKEDVSKNRAYPHNMMGYNQQTGYMENVPVNTEQANTYNENRYYVVPVVETNPELVKANEKEQAMNLAQVGKLSTLDLLRFMDYPNPEKLYENLLREQGINEVVQIMNKYPELQQLIQEYAANQQSPQGEINEGNPAQAANPEE